MAGENPAPNAVDAALNALATPDAVPVPAAELVKLRERAALADRLEGQTASTLTTAALAEATASVTFANDVAARHARELLKGRVVVRADATGNLVAVDRETGRPAVEALLAVASGPEFALYRPAPHQGGASMRGGAAASNPGGLSPEQQIRARREAMVNQWREATGKRTDGRSMARPLKGS